MKKNILFPLIVLTLFISCSESDDMSEVIIPEEEVITEEEQVVNEEVCKIVNKDGLLIIEAESFDLKGSWRIVEDIKASNGKYIEYYGSNSYTTPNLSQEISVKFTVDAGAKYLVKWYMRQPDSAEGDKSNDAWIYFPENLGRAYVNDKSVTLEHYEKFVSRGKGEFVYGGVLDLHDPKASSWLTVVFPRAGEYTLKICARSEFFQLDKLVLSTGISNDEAHEQSKTLSESIECN